MSSQVPNPFGFSLRHWIGCRAATFSLVSIYKLNIHSTYPSQASLCHLLTIVGCQVGAFSSAKMVSRRKKARSQPRGANVILFLSLPFQLPLVSFESHKNKLPPQLVIASYGGYTKGGLATVGLVGPWLDPRFGCHVNHIKTSSESNPKNHHHLPFITLSCKPGLTFLKEHQTFVCKFQLMLLREQR